MLAFTFRRRGPDAGSGDRSGSSQPATQVADVLAPFLLIPLGGIYCQIHEILFEDVRSTPAQSLFWAFATLMPWVVAALLFRARTKPGERRAVLMRRGLLLGLVAWAAGSIAALLLGADAAFAFYSRLPLLAVALLTAALHSVPEPAGLPDGVAANENEPPVAPAEIVYASAAGNYIELHSRERTIIWRQTMLNAERILGPAGFVRVHRSYLVPWRSIEDVARGRKGPVAVALRDGRRLPVSSRYAVNLRTRAA